MSDSESDLSDISPPRKKKVHAPARNKEPLKKVEDNEEDDEEDDEEEEDEEEEEDDDEEDNHRKSKKRRARFSVKDLFHDEAEVDEDEDDDDEEDEDEDDLIRREEDEVLDAMPTARDLDSRRRMLEMFDHDEEEIERYYKEKYDTHSYVDRFGAGEAMADSIVQKERLPGIKDPNLWVLKCRLGEEKATVLALMRKFFAYQSTDTPLQIKSAFAKEGLKGYIYVEAFKQTHVKQALEGISALRMSQFKQQLVPINEMTEVMRVVKEAGRLKPDQWVRIKSGIFRDDLAQVEYVEDAQNLVGLKLVPRIDYERRRNRDGDDGETDGNGNKFRRFKRPPPAIFIASKASDRVQREGSWFLFEGNRYDSDGFLHKQFRINAVVAEGIRPTLAELERFHQSPDSTQLAANAAALGSAAATVGSTDVGVITHCFAPGDVVEVCEGDLRNLRGKVLSVEGNSRIIVQPNHADLREPIPFTPLELRKSFNQGDHVKVLSGRYANETGLVIRFEPTLAIVLSDQSMNELKVAPKDLRLWQDRSATVESSGHVQLMDLVQVDPQTAGVVVRVDREHVSVLTCFGKVVALKGNTALRRINTQRRPPQALDRNGNIVHLKQAVRLLEKPHAGLIGEIRHLYRSWAFVYSRTHLENAGLIVAKARQLAVLTPQQQAQPGEVGPSPLRTITPIAGGGRGVGRGRGGGRGGGDDHKEKPLVGSTARIIRGTLKGLLGIICDATPTHVVLELHSQFKKVPVARENMALLDKNGRIMDTQYAAAPSKATPMRGGRTPQLAYGAQTPHAASFTPRGDSTPLPSAFNAGMATPKISSLDDPMTPSSSFLWPSVSDFNRLPGSSAHSLSDNE